MGPAPRGPEEKWPGPREQSAECEAGEGGSAPRPRAPSPGRNGGQEYQKPRVLLRAQGVKAGGQLACRGAHTHAGRLLPPSPGRGGAQEGVTRRKECWGFESTPPSTYLPRPRSACSAGNCDILGPGFLLTHSHIRCSKTPGLPPRPAHGWGGGGLRARPTSPS